MYIANAVSAGLGGFAIGFIQTCMDNYELVDAQVELTKLQCAQYIENRDKLGEIVERSENARDKTFYAKLGMTLLTGMGVGTYVSAHSPEYYIQNLMVATGGAFFGRFVGGVVRRFTNKWCRETRKLKKAMEDPENLGDYLLTGEVRDVVFDALRRIEQTRLDGRRIDPDDPEGPLADVFNAIKRSPKSYRSNLLRWSIERQKRIYERATAQRVLEQFYKGPTCVFKPVSVGIMGNPEGNTARAFVVEDDRLYLIDIDWPRIKIKKDATTEEIDLMVDVPSVRIWAEEPWNGDYTDLAERVMDEEGNVILINSKPGVPDEAKINAASESFVSTMAKYFASETDD